MSNWIVSSNFPDQLGKSPNNWYQSSSVPILELHQWQSQSIHGGSPELHQWQSHYGQDGSSSWQGSSTASLSSQLGFPEDPRERIVEESLQSVEGMLLNLDKQFETLDWWMEYRKEVYPSYFPVELPPSLPPPPQQQYEAPPSLPQPMQQQCQRLQQYEVTEPKVFDEMPVRKLGSTSWCRRCKIECESMEGLVIHSLTSEHQNRTITLVRNIKQNIYCSNISSTSTTSICPELEQEEEDDTTTRVSDNHGDDVEEQKVAFLDSYYQYVPMRFVQLLMPVSTNHPQLNVQFSVPVVPADVHPKMPATMTSNPSPIQGPSKNVVVDDSCLGPVHSSQGEENKKEDLHHEAEQVGATLFQSHTQSNKESGLVGNTSSQNVVVLRENKMEDSKTKQFVKELGNSTVRPDGQVEFHRFIHSPASSYAKDPSASILGSLIKSMIVGYIDLTNFLSFENAAIVSPTAFPGMDSRTLDGKFSLVPNLTGAADLQNFNQIGSQISATALQMFLEDPLYAQYLRIADYVTQVASNFNSPPTDRGYMHNTYLELLEIQTLPNLQSLLLSSFPSYQHSSRKGLWTPTLMPASQDGPAEFLFDKGNSEQMMVWDPGVAIHRGGCSCNMFSRVELQLAWDPGIHTLLIIQMSNSSEHHDASMFSTKSIKLPKRHPDWRQSNISTVAKTCHPKRRLKEFMITLWDPGKVISTLTLGQGQFEGVGIVTRPFYRQLKIRQ